MPFLKARSDNAADSVLELALSGRTSVLPCLAIIPASDRLCGFWFLLAEANAFMRVCCGMDSTERASLVWPRVVLEGTEGGNGEVGTEAQLLDADPPTLVAAEKEDSDGSSLVLSAVGRVVLSNPSCFSQRESPAPEVVKASGFVGGKEHGRRVASGAPSESR